MTGFGLKLDKSALKNVKVKEHSAENSHFKRVCCSEGNIKYPGSGVKNDFFSPRGCWQSDATPVNIMKNHQPKCDFCLLTKLGEK